MTAWATEADPELELLTINQVAELLKVTRPSVYTLINRGEFGEVVRLGPQSLRIPVSNYRAYIDRNRVRSAS